MNGLEQLDWSNWQVFNDQEKRGIFSKVLMYFVNPLMEIKDIELYDFELYGVKCRTFSLTLNGEDFVFVPGNKEVILGWDLGTEGLSLLETAPCDTTGEIPEEIRTNYDLLDATELAEYVNDHTTPLRKVAIEPMLVQRLALPFGTEYLGRFDTVTGEFHGDAARFSLYEEEIRQELMPELTPEESLNWSFPETALKNGQWYIEMVKGTDSYWVFQHEAHSFETLRKKIRRKNFDLPNEDQWEYFAGAGTRRLFRWGNELAIHDPYRGQLLRQMIASPNMFGIVVDSTLDKYEITDDPRTWKLTDRPLHTHIPLVDLLPLSSYYRSESTADRETVLDPRLFLYRKIIPIKI